MHFATELGPVHFAIYPAGAPGRAGERRCGGSTFPGFYVASLDRAAGALARDGASMLTGHDQMPGAAGSWPKTRTAAPSRLTSAGTAPAHDRPPHWSAS